jgi:hypothetical protein
MRFSLGTGCGGNLRRLPVDFPYHLQVLVLHQILYPACIAGIPEFARAIAFTGEQHASIAEDLSRNTEAGRSQELGLHVQLSSKHRQIVVQAGHGRHRFDLSVLALNAVAFPLIIIHDSAIFIDER